MEDDLKHKFGKQVKKFRLLQKMSQEELAEKIDIAVNNLGEIERGESFVTAATLEKIADVLKVKVQELFQFDSYVLLEEMKRELSPDILNESEIKQLYKFYKSYLKA